MVEMVKVIGDGYRDGDDDGDDEENDDDDNDDDGDEEEDEDDWSGVYFFNLQMKRYFLNATQCYLYLSDIARQLVYS